MYNLCAHLLAYNTYEQALYAGLVLLLLLCLFPIAPDPQDPSPHQQPLDFY